MALFVQFNAGFITVIVQINSIPFAITVISLLPADLQVTLPLLSTTAILLFEDVKVALPTSPITFKLNELPA